MKIEMTFEIPPWKQDFLEADLRYFQADLKYQLCDSVEKMKKNRTFTFKFLNIVRKLPTGMKLTIDTLLTSIEFLREFQILEYKVTHHDGFSAATIDINENYFVLLDLVKTYLPFLKESRKSLAEKIEREMRKTYDSKAIIVVH